MKIREVKARGLPVGKQSNFWYSDEMEKAHAIIRTWMMQTGQLDGETIAPEYSLVLVTAFEHWLNTLHRSGGRDTMAPVYQEMKAEYQRGEDMKALWIPDGLVERVTAEILPYFIIQVDDEKGLTYGTNAKMQVFAAFALERLRRWIETNVGHITPLEYRTIGENNRAMTEDQVREAVKRYQRGELPKTLAREYGVTDQTMRQLLRGETYTTVTGIPNRKASRPWKKLDEQMVADIRRDKEDGATLKELTAKYDLSRTTIRKALGG